MRSATERGPFEAIGLPVTVELAIEALRPAARPFSSG
jgi:hypothetical protein